MPDFKEIKSWYPDKKFLEILAVEFTLAMFEKSVKGDPQGYFEKHLQDEYEVSYKYLEIAYSGGYDHSWPDPPEFMD